MYYYPYPYYPSGGCPVCEPRCPCCGKPMKNVMTPLVGPTYTTYGGTGLSYSGGGGLGPRGGNLAGTSGGKPSCGH